MVYVVKIGGSLLQYPEELRGLCRTLRGLGGEIGILIVPGGGVFADSVRAVYATFRMPGDVAHRMAVLAMDLYGILLNSLFEGGSCLTPDPGDAHAQFKRGVIPILLASTVMSGDNPLPRSWDVTSDSISAYVALMIRAEGLILVKSVDGVEMPAEDAPLKIYDVISTQRLKEVRQTVVDGYLPRVLEMGRVRCFVVNGRFPERVEALLRGRRTVCTEIVPS